MCCRRRPRCRAFWRSAATRSRSTSLSSGLVGVSTQIRRVFGRIAASIASGSDEIEIADLDAHRALAHPLEQAARAAIEVVDRDDMGALVEAFERRRNRRQAGRKGERGAAAFEIGDAALERHARGILGARVIVALVHARALLHVGRRGVDRHHDGAGGRIGLLSRMDAAGGEVESVRSGHSSLAYCRHHARKRRIRQTRHCAAPKRSHACLVNTGCQLARTLTAQEFTPRS